MSSSMYLAVLLSVVIALCSAGCNGNSTTPDAGVDAWEPEPIDEELQRDLTRYCEAVGPVACRVAFDCCDSGERGYFDEISRESACPEFLEPSCLHEVEEVVTARAAVEYDEDAAERLLSRLDDAADSCELSYSELFRALSPRTVLRGRAPTGTECVLISELPICADQCVGNDEDGFRCDEGADEGDECFRSTSGTFYGCASGLVCVYEDSELRCREPLDNGERCNWDHQCVSGYCRGTCVGTEPCRP